MHTYRLPVHTAGTLWQDLWDRDCTQFWDYSFSASMPYFPNSDWLFAVSFVQTSLPLLSLFKAYFIRDLVCGMQEAQGLVYFPIPGFPDSGPGTPETKHSLLFSLLKHTLNRQWPGLVGVFEQGNLLSVLDSGIFHGWNWATCHNQLHWPHF